MALSRRIFAILPRLALPLLLSVAMSVGAVGSHAAETARFVYGREPSQFGELWLPEARSALPVVVLIHGGCWQYAYGLDLMAGLAEDLRRQGLAVWNIEYRRLGERGSGYPGTFLDVGNAVDTLRGLAPRYGLNLGRVATVGHSAGGHLALWAAARPRLPRTSAVAMAAPLPIAGVVSLAGIADLEAYRNGGAGACGGAATIDAVTGATGRPGQNVYADTSPRALLPLGVPQIVAAGGQDGIVPSAFAASYTDAATAAGDCAELLEFPDADHFALIEPRSTAWTAIKAKLLALLR
jgi:acetyl esterase/lipase